MNAAHTKFLRRYSIANDNISFDIENPMDYTNDNFTNSDSIDNSASSSNDESFVQEGILSDVPSESFLPRQWRIKDEDVTELPDIYPRLSSPLIIRNCDISKIGETLFDYLKVNSVRSVYDNQRARIFCYTERASFVVQFWRRKISVTTDATTTSTAADKTSINQEIEGNESTQNEEVILEVQRRQGCSYAMHKIRIALKKSILPQSSFPGGSRCSSNSTSRPMIRYERIILQHQNQSFKRPSDEELMTIRKRMRCSEFLAPPPHTIAPRRVSTTSIGSIDSLIISTRKALPSQQERQRGSSSSIDSLINKSIFVALASIDPSTLDNNDNETATPSTFAMLE
mmetsp:Transcript_17266/g.35443  ORF Transcript_17266/g.35443 Transcript_17266/m.35443 type:complete len:342 (-) Transcript_17266:427-1452(-)|eukprot:CAMPEP_0168247756 /NCGR_PEP_ID=MMETSP0141_2-20121125/1086_1 /TAXON_ID=44445 /ORGANISM="Pseudo-nitzschia australis, Strain 10249 10 AB" /LENGTH=341 /DNA_ID=CAMNT_0008183601 /DNA_START=64 /DNA_END=1089 /DNA_ORIENTATION=-